MMVTPLAVLPNAVPPASNEPSVEAPDGATTPFLAILAAAVASPLPEPVTPTVPPRVVRAQGDGGEAEAGEASAQASHGAVLPVADATEPPTVARPTVLVNGRSPRQSEARHAAPSASEGASPDTLAGTITAEPASEEARRSEPGAEAALPLVDAGSPEAAAGNPAALIAQPSPKAADAAAASVDALTQPAHADTTRRASTTPGLGAGAVPSNAAQATAAGVLAAFSTNNVERGLGTMPTANASSGVDAAPISVASAPTAATVAPGADDAALLSLPGATVTASASGDVAPRSAADVPAVAAIATAPATETAAVHGELPSVASPTEREEQAPALARIARRPVREDALPDSAPLVRAPWVATPTVLPEARGDAPDVGPLPSERAPRAEQGAPSHVTVELDPETAGASRVRVAVRGDVVHATVVTDAGGADAMRPQLGELRQALEGQGFREATVQVRTSGESGAPHLASQGTDVRGRPDSAAAGEGQTQEHHPRGRQRGHDQPTADQRAPTDPDEEQT